MVVHINSCRQCSIVTQISNSFKVPYMAAHDQQKDIHTRKDTTSSQIGSSHVYPSKTTNVHRKTVRRMRHENTFYWKLFNNIEDHNTRVAHANARVTQAR